MTKKQNEILQFLSKFKSASIDQLEFFTKCSVQDINYLISEGLILKDEIMNYKIIKIKIYYDSKRANI